MKRSYFLLNEDMCFDLSVYTHNTALSPENCVYILHNDKHTDTQSLSVISNWFVVHRHVVFLSLLLHHVFLLLFLQLFF